MGMRIGMEIEKRALSGGILGGFMGVGKFRNGRSRRSRPIRMLGRIALRKSERGTIRTLTMYRYFSMRKRTRLVTR